MGWQQVSDLAGRLAFVGDLPREIEGTNGLRVPATFETKPTVFVLTHPIIASSQSRGAQQAYLLFLLP